MTNEDRARDARVTWPVAIVFLGMAVFLAIMFVMAIADIESGEKWSRGTLAEWGAVAVGGIATAVSLYGVSLLKRTLGLQQDLTAEQTVLIGEQVLEIQASRTERREAQAKLIQTSFGEYEDGPQATGAFRRSGFHLAVKNCSTLPISGIRASLYVRDSGSAVPPLAVNEALSATQEAMLPLPLSTANALGGESRLSIRNLNDNVEYKVVFTDAVGVKWSSTHKGQLVEVKDEASA